MTESFMPLALAPKAIITAIEITRHRLHFDPPFNASWDSRPRTFWDAAIVRVHTDLGVTGRKYKVRSIERVNHVHQGESASLQRIAIEIRHYLAILPSERRRHRRCRHGIPGSRDRADQPRGPRHNRA